MGLFGGSKTYVASVVYNTAGDYSERENYLSFLVSTSILTPEAELAEGIVTGTLQGPGFRFRSFYRWALDHFTIGLPHRVTLGSASIDPDEVEGEITPSVGGRTIWCQSAEIGRADYQVWAEQYIMNNYPARMSYDWTATIDNSNDITIDWGILWSPITFTPSNYFPRSKYIYARYLELGKTGSLWDYASNSLVFIYKLGSGNATLDALDESAPALGGFFPMIPIRTSGTFVNEAPYDSAIYDDVQATWKKLTGGGHFEDLIDQIADNEDIDDIDHACVVFGVPLNTQSKCGRRYIYEFLKELMDIQLAEEADYTDFQDNQYPTYESYLTAFKAWIEDVNTGAGTYDPPPREVTPNPPISTIRLHPTNEYTDHMDFYISWRYIKQTTHSGLSQVGAVKNDVWLEKGTAKTFTDEYYTGIWSSLNHSDEVMYVYFQNEDNEYKKLEVVGLVHRNLIYNNKSVEITSDEALDDTDDSGFFLPLTYGSLKAVPVTLANQLCTESTLIIFNSFEVVKQKWYQTWIFKLALIAVSIGLSVITAGGSLAAAGGILGTNAAVGAAMGLGGIAGAIAGAVANAVVAMIVTQILTYGAQKLIGGQLGAIIGSVLAVVAVMAGSGFAMGNFQWESLLRADNLLKLTEAGIGGYQRALAMETQNTYNQIQALQVSYEERSSEIERLNFDLMGSATGVNPMLLTESSLVHPESPGVYLTRTLMTGSDIAELTHQMISDFAKQTLSLPKG